MNAFFGLLSCKMTTSASNP